MAKDQRWPTCPLKGNGWINHITASFTAIKKNNEPIQRPLQDILLNEKKKTQDAELHYSTLPFM